MATLIREKLLNNTHPINFIDLKYKVIAPGDQEKTESSFALLTERLEHTPDVMVEKIYEDQSIIYRISLKSQPKKADASEFTPFSFWINGRYRGTYVEIKEINWISDSILPQIIESTNA